MTFDDRVDVGRRGGTRPENTRGAHSERKVAGVSEPVCEEQLRHAEAAVTLADAEDADAEQRRAHHHVMVKMHTSFGGPGAAGGVEPECRRVVARLYNSDRGTRVREQPIERPSRAGDDDMPELWSLGAWYCLDGCPQCVAHDQHARARISEHVAIVRRLPQCIDGDRYRTYRDSAKERVKESGPVVQQQHDAVAAVHTARIAERIAAAVDAFRQLAVGDALVAAFDGDFGGAPFRDVAIDKPRRGVELLGYAEFGRSALLTAHPPMRITRRLR